MANWTNTTQNSTSWNTETDNSFITGGQPLGLLLTITFANPVNKLTWTEASINSASWTNSTQN